MEKFTNQQELQIKTKSLISDVQKGNKYIIMRYSKPVGVLLSIEEYESILNGNCNKCNGNLKKVLEKIK
jgi:prevent-host-death family protein